MAEHQRVIGLDIDDTITAPPTQVRFIEFERTPVRKHGGYHFV
jgi:hypothetical protein